MYPQYACFCAETEVSRWECEATSQRLGRAAIDVALANVEADQSRASCVEWEWAQSEDRVYLGKMRCAEWTSGGSYRAELEGDILRHGKHDRTAGQSRNMCARQNALTRQLARGQL